MKYRLGVAALLALAALSSPASAFDQHQRVELDDGTGVNPPDAPLGSVANPMNVTGGGSGSSSFSAITSSSITRPANTTPYAAYEGWNNATSGATGYLTFSGACSAAGKNVLVPEIDIYSSNNPTTTLSGILWLFSAIPGTLINDGGAFTIASADFANLDGGMQGFPFSLGNATGSTGNVNSGISLTGVPYHAKCASGAATIYGVFEVTNAYSGASSEVLTATLHTLGVN